MDKAACKEIAKRNGIETPDWQLIQKANQEVKISPPFVVKPNDQGSTIGLSIVKDDQFTTWGREIQPGTTAHIKLKKRGGPALSGINTA